MTPSAQRAKKNSATPATAAPRYELPDLPMGVDGWEPWCSAEIVDLHHGKHHAAYVKKANETVDALRDADPEDATTVNGLQRTLTFNAAGHELHTLFWSSLANEPTKPTGALRSAIDAQFGGMRALNARLQSAAAGVHGSGWIHLSADDAGRLGVGLIHDHHHDLVPHTRLLFIIDLWEHAYYLQYRNAKDSWTSAAISHIDWAQASIRFAELANRTT
jgi:superoxide dismutase, Fe-Mn family